MPTEVADVYTIAKFGSIEKFEEQLLEKDINEKSDYGSSLLHYAISEGKNEIALFLIEKGIDVNLTNQEGQTALHLLCANGNIMVAKKILEIGGDINIKDKYGNNALWTAVFNCKGKNYEMVSLLVKHKFDILSQNQAGRSPLDFAKQISDRKLLAILEKGMDQ